MKKTVILVLVIMGFIGCTNKNKTTFTFNDYEGPFVLVAKKDTLISGNVSKTNNVLEFEWTKEFKSPNMVSVRLSADYRSAYCYFEKGAYKITTRGKDIVVSSKINDEILQVEKAITQSQKYKELQNKIRDLGKQKIEIEKRISSIKDKNSQERKAITNEWINVENARLKALKESKALASELAFSCKEGLPLCIYLMKNRRQYIYDVCSGEKVVQIAKNVHAKEQSDFTAKLVEGFTGMLESEKQKELTKVGNQYTDLVANDLNGNPVKLSEVLAKNKIVLIKFWASWCGPCVRSIPETLELTKKYGKKGFQVYAISLDSKKKYWEKAIEKHKISSWVNTSELKGWDGKEHHKYGVTGVPKEILISKEGKILGVNLRKAWLERHVKEACE
ncbi:TlpA family protein disulfide reductase [Marinifilum sp. D737]|uniref:TlpA family protein disulfide reductase n=1 Tax=Marinifilum sp. D737 TaxID=2969628 RepID=UPI002DD44180|nr:TlpA disulfide reductase family protein [Marinifilum sp. D737]